MKKVFLDASSAILLLRADLLPMLTSFYHVSITRSVFQELTGNVRYGAEIFHRYAVEEKLKIYTVENMLGSGIAPCKSFGSLHQGESDTIRCFQSGKHDFIIIDDGPAARYCYKNKIDFINALLFPRVLLFNNSISDNECKSYMNDLVRLGRYSSEVITWANNCKRESLLFAILDNCGIDR